MPSPFPGMDPYLEARAIWPGVHISLMTYIHEQLQPQLRPKYLARIGERIQLTSRNAYIPDVMLARRLREPAPVLTMEPPLVVDEPLLIEAIDEDYREPYVEIIALDSGEVVTLIELLSPANKVGRGREQYIDKQRELLATAVNLVEIDLLGYGEPTVLARHAPIAEPPDWRYLISISRGDPDRDRSGGEPPLPLEVYPIPLRQRLPRGRIPLRPPDEDVVLDLPAVFTRCYDAGGYDLLIDYGQPPDTLLSEAEAAWLEEFLQDHRQTTNDERPND
jgi:hypothetical protein